MSIYTHPFLNAYRFYSDPKTVPLLPRRLQDDLARFSNAGKYIDIELSKKPGFSGPTSFLISNASKLSTTGVFLSDLLHIKPIALGQGTLLGDWIYREVSKGNVDASAPIHLIGHSAGGFVMGNAAEFLYKTRLQIPVDRVTMLDTPMPEYSHMLYLPNPTYVDRYISSAFGFAAWDGVNDLPVSPERSYIFRKIPTDIKFELNQKEAHSEGYRWYRRSIADSSAEDGFIKSPFLRGPVATRPLNKDHSKPQTKSNKNDDCLGFSKAQFFGTHEVMGSMVTLIEDRDSGFYFSEDWITEAPQVIFEFQFFGESDGDYLLVSQGNQTLFQEADFESLRGIWSEVTLDSQQFQNPDEDLIFTLVSQNDSAAELRIRCLKVERRDDSDNDGLSFTEELALGTDPRLKDSDFDGVADNLELPESNPAVADTDLDGQDDLQERIAGTDPRDPSSSLKLQLLKIGQDTITLDWETVVGREYEIHASEDLWFRSFSIFKEPIQGQGLRLEMQNADEPRRFFRLLAKPK